MRVVPSFFAVTFPVGLTSATDFFDERQVIFFFVPYTLSCVVFPTRRDAVFLFSLTFAAWEFAESVSIPEIMRHAVSVREITFFILPMFTIPFLS